MVSCPPGFKVPPLEHKIRHFQFSHHWILKLPSPHRLTMYLYALHHVTFTHYTNVLMDPLSKEANSLLDIATRKEYELMGDFH